MFSLHESFEMDRPILKCDNIRYTPPSLATIDEVNSLVFNDIEPIPACSSIVYSRGIMERRLRPTHFSTAFFRLARPYESFGEKQSQPEDSWSAYNSKGKATIKLQGKGKHIRQRKKPLLHFSEGDHDCSI